MTTRNQRERLIGRDQVDVVFSDEVCRQIWDGAFPRRSGAMPPDFPTRLRLRVRAYVEMAGRPSRGEINAAAEGLYRRLWKAIEVDDRDAAALALEKMPETIHAELDRWTRAAFPQLCKYGIRRTGSRGRGSC
jgi:hypothetical protein